MKFIDGIDWKLLREQKQRLVQQAGIGSGEAEGLLGLLDALQNAAVDERGLSEDRVFGPAAEE